MNSSQIVLFEPWSLGDAVIAARALTTLQRGDPDCKAALACATRYLPLLSELFPGLAFDPIDLPYTVRGPKKGNPISPSTIRPSTVFSIRGDFRDYRAAQCRYPRAHIRITGWASFVIRRLPVLDEIFRREFLRTINRYDRWSSVLGLPNLENEVREPKQSPTIAIHLGAQWGARRYPHVLALWKILKKYSNRVHILGGPGDSRSIGSIKTKFLSDDSLVKFLREEIDLVIANDSAPLHIASAIGLPTIGIFGNNSAAEWAPPNTIILTEMFQGGYRPKYPYQSDDSFSGGRPWPTPEKIVRELERRKWLGF